MPNTHILSLEEIGFLSDIDETGSTLDENSMLKAQTIWEWLSKNSISKAKNITIDGVFADDTGLEIDALNGAPGVYTARWYMMSDVRCQMSDVRCQMLDGGCQMADGAGQMLDGAGQNRAKALRILAGNTNRGAQFRTVITLIRIENGAPSTIQVEGIVRGCIAEEEYGNGGFGYDPIFIPEGYDKTFAELPSEVKNSISHRGRALTALVKLQNL
jgi:XTP/dITP diphosphohydrolase